MPSLNTARLKMMRASQHLDELDMLFRGFQLVNPYQIIGQCDAEETMYTYRIKEVIHPSPFMSLIIGEIAYQLRSALDHVAWQLSLINTPTPYDRTAFPIFLSPDKFEESAPRVMRDIDQAGKAVIESLQPYHRVGGAKFDPLWMLHELNNMDKHRVINPVVAAVNFPMMDGQVEVVATGPLNDGDVFARLPGHLNPKEEFEPKVKILIRLSVGGPAGGEGITIMRQIYDYVGQVVIPAFSRFLPNAKKSV